MQPHRLPSPQKPKMDQMPSPFWHTADVCWQKPEKMSLKLYFLCHKDCQELFLVPLFRWMRQYCPAWFAGPAYIHNIPTWNNILNPNRLRLGTGGLPGPKSNDQDPFNDCLICWGKQPGACRALPINIWGHAFIQTPESWITISTTQPPSPKSHMYTADTCKFLYWWYGALPAHGFRVWGHLNSKQLSYSRSACKLLKECASPSNISYITWAN